MELADKILALSDPACFGESAGPIKVIQTHISVVFLTSRFAYKLKKPVRFEFLDFSTLSAREAACREELRLNRRLACEIYLDVVPLLELPGGTLRIGTVDEQATGTSGKIVDYLVKMRLLPLERCLDRLIVEHRVEPADTAAVATLLTDFYACAEPLAISAQEYRQHIEHHVRANRADLLAAGSQLDTYAIRRVHAAQLQSLRLCGAVFDARVAAGKIVDGHGDLRPEHVCLLSPPVIFDCIEFSAELRQIDAADELGFLQMECEALGAPQVGQAIVAAFEAASGDRAPEPLRHFYISYRACVRAKVAALRARQLAASAAGESLKSENPAQAAWASANRYLQLADAHAGQFARPVLLVVGGLMGSGKSTLARRLASVLGAELLQTDVVRCELFGESDAAVGFGQDKYDPQSKAAVYGELFDRAGRLIDQGLSVVLDGAFLTAALRASALRLAVSGGRALLVECRCPAEVAQQRIAARLARGGDASEARPELLALQKQHAEPIIAARSALSIDTTLPLEAQVAAVCERLATL